MTLIETLQSEAGKRLLIGGHRGHASATRENTRSNFSEVLGCGISHIEIDVQLTRDGIPVIYHDMELSDRTALHGMVRDHTLAQLRQAFEIDTLDEALAWCHEHHQPLLLEIKTREMDMHDELPLLAEKIAAAIPAHDMLENCIVFGIDHHTLMLVKRHEPRVHLALIVPHVPADPVALMRDMDAVIYLCFIDNLSRPLVDQLHAAGYLVDGSVINDEARLQKALELGVDMIESDYPERLLVAYASHTEGRA